MDGVKTDDGDGDGAEKTADKDDLNDTKVDKNDKEQMSLLEEMRRHVKKVGLLSPFFFYVLFADDGVWTSCHFCFLTTARGPEEAAGRASFSDQKSLKRTEKSQIQTTTLLLRA